MKKCNKCGIEKSLDDFSFKNKSKGTYQSNCVLCDKVIRKEAYEKNKQTTLDRNKRNREKNRLWFTNYKKTLKCSECPESHVACLEFHHTDPTQKDNAVSEMVSSYSISSMKKEIAKCVVLCSNCHRKRHYEEMQV